MVNNTTARERAERAFRTQAEGKQAMSEYMAEQARWRANMERLRAERLAREKGQT